MLIYDNGTYREATEEDIAEMSAFDDSEYWANVSYDEAVNDEIRKRYSASQEFAILRQKDEKPEEYAKYYAYCEECKAYAKERKGAIQ